MILLYRIKPSNGIGIRSIISVIEKYNGVYDFFTEDGVFYFQACI
ncbi:MAG: GHKL domain-containing protein [Lachnospira pectinoschiza]